MKRAMFGAVVMAMMAGMLVLSSGCASQTCIVVANMTGIGIVAEYNQQTQTPTGKVGYINAVVGIVPTNRMADDQPDSAIGSGAKDSPNVLFETNFSNFFSFWNENGIYQRVAVGDLAVTQPGAVAMMAKDRSGKLDTEAIKALSGIKTVTPAVADLKAKLVELGKDEAKKKLILDKLAAMKVPSWDAFIDGKPELTDVQLQTILNEVSK